MLAKIIDIITIGFPFGVFKITSGWYFESNLLLWWGFADIFINCLNFILILIFRKKLLPTCLMAIIGHKLGSLISQNSDSSEDIGESLDVLASFLIVAIVIGYGFIADFPTEMLHAWNTSVVLNVLGAGASRVFSSVHRFRSHL